jgi:enoyl-CoA hydratase/carnithine racemase
VENLPIQDQPQLVRVIRTGTAEVCINRPLALNALSADVIDNLSDIVLVGFSPCKCV